MDGYNPQTIPEESAGSAKVATLAKSKMVESIQNDISKKARDDRILKQNIIKYERLLACHGQRTVGFIIYTADLTPI